MTPSIETPVHAHASWWTRRAFIHHVKHRVSHQPDVLELQARLRNKTWGTPVLTPAYFLPMGLVLTAKGFRHGEYRPDWPTSYYSHQRLHAANLIAVGSVAEADAALQARIRELVQDPEATIGTAGVSKRRLHRLQVKDRLERVSNVFIRRPRGWWRKLKAAAPLRRE